MDGLMMMMTNRVGVCGPHTHNVVQQCCCQSGRSVSMSMDGLRPIAPHFHVGDGRMLCAVDVRNCRCLTSSPPRATRIARPRADTENASHSRRCGRPFDLSHQRYTSQPMFVPNLISIYSQILKTVFMCCVREIVRICEMIRVRTRSVHGCVNYTNRIVQIPNLIAKHDCQKTRFTAHFEPGLGS